MKNDIVKVVAIAMLLSLLLSLLTGCFSKDSVADGPGMVNYPGILLDELVGDWESDNDNYSITFWDDMTFSLSYNYEPLLDSAALTLYIDSTDTDAYNEFDVNPNVFTDEAGGSVTITKASHENGAVTLELTAQDGTKKTITFRQNAQNIPDDLQPLDGPGMVYYGGYLDEAITGCWYSEDGRFTLDFDSKYADFYLDGKQLASKDDGYFLDHNFSEDDDLNERCELYARNNFLEVFAEAPLTISEMWYQAEHIYMNVVWPDGAAEEVVFSKQDEAMPEGDWKEIPETAEGEAATVEEEDESAQTEAFQTITMELNQGDECMTVTFSALPATLDEFNALAEGKLQNPENTCALFLLALNMYTADKDAGLKAIDVLRGPRPMNGFDTQFIKDRLRDKTYLPLAYFDGATPENNYAPTEPYTLRLHADARPQDCEDGYMRLFLETAGADSTRPIKLRQKGDEWFLWEYSSVLSGIRTPAAADPWA